MTRYKMLREAVGNLAASPAAQVAYLDESFASLTGGGSAAAYGNDELVLEFDIFLASPHMLECGAITQSEIDAVRPLDELLQRYCDQQDDRFWVREALFTDDRWENLRRCATKALVGLPDEIRESDYIRSLKSEPILPVKDPRVRFRLPTGVTRLFGRR